MKGHKHGHHHAKGGHVEPELHPKAYDAGDINVEKEAEEKKHGGPAHHKKRKHFKHGGHVEGHHAKHRLDRRGRKRGGAAGSDMKPLSTASRVHDATEHKAEEGDAERGP